MRIPERLYTNGAKVGQVRPATPDEIAEAARAAGHPMRGMEKMGAAEKLIIGYEVLTLVASMGAATDDDMYNYGRARQAVIAYLPSWMRAPVRTLPEFENEVRADV